MVELLLVISIICILAALLLPSIGRVRELAKRTQCMSNMRQIGMVTYLYAADYNGYGPWDPEYTFNYLFTNYRGTWGFPFNKWFGEYFSDASDRKQTRCGYCPKGGRYGDKGPYVPYLDPTWPLANTSYGINANIIVPDQRYYTKLAQVPMPSKTMLWFETCIGGRQYDTKDITGRHNSYAKVYRTTVGGYDKYQCYGIANTMFVDQHMETRRVPQDIPTYIAIPSPGNNTNSFWFPVSL